MLRAADVAGVLLLPTVRSVELVDYIDWSRFPVVSTTHQVTAPEFHRVGADHLGNTLAMCRHLVAQGHRRLGYIGDETTDAMVERGLISAVQWLNANSHGDVITLSVYSRMTLMTVEEWIDLERPRLVIADTHVTAEKIMDELGASRLPVTFATYAHAGSTRWPGIDQHYRGIGQSAVNQLHSRIQASEKGIPEVATTMSIRGEWVEGGLEQAFEGDVTHKPNGAFPPPKNTTSNFPYLP